MEIMSRATAYMSLEARWRRRVIIAGLGECWGWQGGPYGDDFYPAIKYEGGWHYIHRVSWNIHHGQIHDGLFVLHKCDNRRCSNPEHLFLGTAGDNVRDMIAKGRGPLQTYKTNPAAKLNVTTAAAAKSLLREGWSRGRIAAHLGVSREIVRSVERGKTWRRVLAATIQASAP